MLSNLKVIFVSIAPLYHFFAKDNNETSIFHYSDTILKNYSSTAVTIFTGFASAALFGHTLTIDFILGISIVFISMHQFFSPLSDVKEEENGVLELESVKKLTG
ncbi:putative nucleotide-sugar transporter [Helianthus anomalus]